MNISTNYNLGLTQGDLDFVDIRLHRDNLLFVDPRLIAISNKTIIINMQNQLEVYLAELIDSIKAKANMQTNYFLSGLSEPKETRLGYSDKSSNGNSIGDKLKPKLEEALSKSKLLKFGILKHLGDFDLFIEDVRCDRVSDITTKIIKPFLIQFTQEQCVKHGIPMLEVTQKHLFNSETLKWEQKKVELPVYLGQPIIFVPKDIVRRKNDADSNLGCFYRYAIRNYIANDMEMIDGIESTGKDGVILLRDIKKKYPFSKLDSANWLIKFPKLLVDYKTNVMNQRLRVLTDEEIEFLIYDNSLSNVG